MAYSPNVPPSTWGDYQWGDHGDDQLAHDPTVPRSRRRQVKSTDRPRLTRRSVGEISLQPTTTIARTTIQPITQPAIQPMPVMTAPTPMIVQPVSQPIMQQPMVPTQPIVQQPLTTGFTSESVTLPSSPIRAPAPAPEPSPMLSQPITAPMVMRSISAPIAQPILQPPIDTGYTSESATLPLSPTRIPEVERALSPTFSDLIQDTPILSTPTRLPALQLPSEPTRLPAPLLPSEPTRLPAPLLPSEPTRLPAPLLPSEPTRLPAPLLPSEPMRLQTALDLKQSISRLISDQVTPQPIIQEPERLPVTPLPTDPMIKMIRQPLTTSSLISDQVTPQPIIQEPERLPAPLLPDAPERLPSIPLPEKLPIYQVEQVKPTLTISRLISDEVLPQPKPIISYPVEPMRPAPAPAPAPVVSSLIEPSIQDGAYPTIPTPEMAPQPVFTPTPMFTPTPSATTTPSVSPTPIRTTLSRLVSDAIVTPPPTRPIPISTGTRIVRQPTPTQLPLIAPPVIGSRWPITSTQIAPSLVQTPWFTPSYQLPAYVQPPTFYRPPTTQVARSVAPSQPIVDPVQTSVDEGGEYIDAAAADPTGTEQSLYEKAALETVNEQDPPSSHSWWWLVAVATGVGYYGYKKGWFS